MPSVPTDERVLAALQRVTDAALAHLSEDDLLTELLRRIAEILDSDTAAVLLLEPNGEYLRARAAKGIEEEVEQGVRIPVGAGFAGRVAADRRAIFIEDVEQADIFNPILREKGIRSLLGVPLLIEGRVIGVMHVGSLTPRHFTDDERDLLQLAADRAALAIEQRCCSSASARPAWRPSRRPRGSRRSSASPTHRWRTCPRTSCCRAAGARQRDPPQRHRRDPAARAQRRVPARARRQGHRGGGRAGRPHPGRRGLRRPDRRRAAARSSIEDVDHADILNPILREKGIRSLLGVPLLIEGRVLGVMHVGSLTPRVFTAEDARPAPARRRPRRTGDRAGAAVRAATARRGAPAAAAARERIAGIPGVELATPLPAGEQREPRRRLVRRVHAPGPGRIVRVRRRRRRARPRGRRGDGAAAHGAARLRDRRHDAAAEVVERVNRMMWQLGPTAMTTLAYVVIDPGAESLELVNAGHPPPLVIAPDGEAGLPAAAGRDRARRVAGRHATAA